MIDVYTVSGLAVHINFKALNNRWDCCMIPESDNPAIIKSLPALRVALALEEPVPSHSSPI
jgi:hypothetical protein